MAQSRISSEHVFLWVYRAIFIPLVVLLSPKYLLRMHRRGGYEADFPTRLGIGLRVPAKSPARKRIWIQAVSLGEMLVIEPLLKALEKDDRYEIALSVTTSTGYALAKERYGDSIISLFYFPLDFWLISRHVWRTVQPDLVISIETEMWPEHMEQARRFGTPAMLINGRISNRSFPVTRRLAGLFARQFDGLTRVLAASPRDAERFEAIGVPADRIEMTGNLKVDVQIDRLGESDRRSLRKELGLGDGFTLLGSSTWPGEEATLLQAFRRIRKMDRTARLIVVPRHGERRGEVESLLKSEAADLRWHFKSKGLPAGEVDILVADTHGELRMLSRVSDLAFVGKSLPPHTEGQTPVEAGALGVPAVFGPGMSNFPGVADALVHAGAAVSVGDAKGAIEKIAELSGLPEERERMSRSGLAWHKSSQGALSKALNAIDSSLFGG